MDIHTGYPFFYAFLAYLNYYAYICDVMLIDDIRKQGTMSNVKVPIDGVLYQGHVSSKPINPRWFKTRFRDALKVFRGKAIAVQYFDDLTDDQKRAYIKKEMGL